jgi:nucleoside-diphosphate-sugar epimerase
VRVLVTGHRGYIGSVLTGVLRERALDVVGLDSDLFAGCDFGRMSERVPWLQRDIRDVESTDLHSCDAVVHLAGLSEDPTGMIPSRLMESVNVAGTLRLATCCKRAGVSRFVFASSCAVYGNTSGAVVTEDAPLSPLTPYAASKACCERELARLADGRFVPVFLRNATCYGVSPRLRTDLVVNDFTASAFSRGRVVMRTAGRSWRPLVHVEDLARVIAGVLTAPDGAVACQAFNVLPPGENHRVVEIADQVTEAVPDCFRRQPEGVFDHRSYRADASRLVSLLPERTLRWTLSLGIRQLLAAFRSSGMTPGQWRSELYRRQLRLAALIERDEIDGDLRRIRSVAA